MDKCELQKILDNIHNIVWYRLSRYYNSYFTSYTVNDVVDEMFKTQREWTKSARLSLRDLALEMFKKNGFEQFQLLSAELRSSTVCKRTINVIIYVCIQLVKYYIDIGEVFAVKYFVMDMQSNLANALE